MYCPNPVALSVFGRPIYWYGILISISVMLAVMLLYFGAKKKGLNPDRMLDYALITVPIAIVFARLYYVAFEWQQYADDPIRALYIWEGGIAIYGAVIGGVLATFLFSKWKKISFWTLADLVAPGLVLGQAIGRWGNFFNQEAFGYAVTNKSLQFFPYAVYIERLAQSPEGPWHLATFFYESMACLAIFLFLMLYRRKERPDGNIFLWYWLLYGIERFFVEGMRTDSLWMLRDGLPLGNLILFPEGIRVSQALSLVMAIAFGIVLIVRFVNRKKAAAVDQPATLDPDLVVIARDEANAIEEEGTQDQQEQGKTEGADQQNVSADEQTED